MTRLSTLFVIVLGVTGCYHATVETGLPPSNRKLEKHWASSWIAGLVPPSTVETAERCPNGVAKVETKLSFLNQVVAAVTLGIYTPMYIEVTCAEGGIADAEPDLSVETDATAEEKHRVLQQAAGLAAAEGRPVVVAF